MNFAKPAIDVGLYTNNLEPMLAFWRETVGLAGTEMLPVGGGVRQHRHAIGNTVLKVNHAREPLPPAPAGGVAALTIATDARSPAALTDPDGNAINLVAPGSGGVSQIEVTLAANNVQRSEAFYADTLGFEPLGDGVLRCGDSRIRLEPGQVAPDPMQRAPGYRYLTVQVYDVVAEHAAALAAGANEGMAPVKLGDVAYISFIRDPDGNWIEISQRKSLVGSLD